MIYVLDKESKVYSGLVDQQIFCVVWGSITGFNGANLALKFFVYTIIFNFYESGNDTRHSFKAKKIIIITR